MLVPEFRYEFGKSSGPICVNYSKDAFRYRKEKNNRGRIPDLSPQEQHRRALEGVEQNGGDPDNELHVLGQYRINHTEWKGNTFVWMLSNILSYCGYIIDDMMAKKEKERSDDPVSFAKFALMRYLMRFKEGQQMVAIKKQQRLKGQLATASLGRPQGPARPPSTSAGQLATASLGRPQGPARPPSTSAGQLATASFGRSQGPARPPSTSAGQLATASFGRSQGPARPPSTSAGQLATASLGRPQGPARPPSTSAGQLATASFGRPQGPARPPSTSAGQLATASFGRPQGPARPPSTSAGQLATASFGRSQGPARPPSTSAGQLATASLGRPQGPARPPSTSAGQLATASFGRPQGPARPPSTSAGQLATASFGRPQGPARPPSTSAGQLATASLGRPQGPARPPSTSAGQLATASFGRSQGPARPPSTSAGQLATASLGRPQGPARPPSTSAGQLATASLGRPQGPARPPSTSAGQLATASFGRPQGPARPPSTSAGKMLEGWSKKLPQLDHKWVSASFFRENPLTRKPEFVEQKALQMWHHPPPLRHTFNTPPTLEEFFSHRLFVWMPVRAHKYVVHCPDPTCDPTSVLALAGLYQKIREVLDSTGFYYMCTEYLQCKKCSKKFVAWSPEVRSQLDISMQLKFPAILTKQYACDRTVITEMKERGLGNGPYQLHKKLMERHTTAHKEKTLHYIVACQSFSKAAQSGIVLKPDFREPPPMTLVPQYKWVMTVYVQDVLQRMEHVKASITSVFGNILKLDSTKKITRKLAGDAKGTALWSTNVGNEHGQVLMSVLTCKEGGSGLQLMAEGIIRRYKNAQATAPQVLYVDRDCCGSTSYLNRLFTQSWPDLHIRLDIWHFMRRIASACTSESHPLYQLFMARMSMCVFEWDKEDMQRLVLAKSGEATHINQDVEKLLTRREKALHCRRKTRPSQEISDNIQELLTAFGGEQGRDLLGVPLLDSYRLEHVRRTVLKHVECLRDPEGVMLYQQVSTQLKGGVELPVFRCGRGSTSLESFHLHLNRFIPGTTSSATNMQAFLLEGIMRWNIDRRAEALGQKKGGVRSGCYDLQLNHAVNSAYHDVFGKHLDSDHQDPKQYTGELIGVDYLFDQTGKPLEALPTDVDNFDLDAADLEEVENDQDLDFTVPDFEDFLPFPVPQVYDQVPPSSPACSPDRFDLAEEDPQSEAQEWLVAAGHVPCFPSLELLPSIYKPRFSRSVSATVTSASATVTSGKDLAEEDPQFEAGERLVAAGHVPCFPSLELLPSIYKPRFSRSVSATVTSASATVTSGKDLAEEDPRFEAEERLVAAGHVPCFPSLELLPSIYKPRFSRSVSATVTSASATVTSGKGLTEESPTIDSPAAVDVSESGLAGTDSDSQLWDLANCLAKLHMQCHPLTSEQCKIINALWDQLPVRFQQPSYHRHVKTRKPTGRFKSSKQPADATAECSKKSMVAHGRMPASCPDANPRMEALSFRLVAMFDKDITVNGKRVPRMTRVLRAYSSIQRLCRGLEKLQLEMINEHTLKFWFNTDEKEAMRRNLELGVFTRLSVLSSTTCAPVPAALVQATAFPAPPTSVPDHQFILPASTIGQSIHQPRVLGRKRTPTSKPVPKPRQNPTIAPAPSAVVAIRYGPRLLMLPQPLTVQRSPAVVCQSTANKRKAREQKEQAGTVKRQRYNRKEGTNCGSCGEPRVEPSHKQYFGHRWCQRTSPMTEEQWKSNLKASGVGKKK